MLTIVGVCMKKEYYPSIFISIWNRLSKVHAYLSKELEESLVCITPKMS